MIHIPSDKKGRIKLCNELVEQCRASSGARSNYYRLLHVISETGRQDGTRSKINMVHDLMDRLASHLYSPTELRFTIDFENAYDKNHLERAKVAARILTREWERTNTDMTFGRGVYEAVKYGACILKQWVQMEGSKETPVYHKRLVMPWNFAVYREDENELNKQAVLCETMTLSLPEVWTRIAHFPEADTLYKRIRSHAQRGLAPEAPNSFLHQVLSTSQLQTTGIQNQPSRPGGIVALGGDPAQAVMGPQLDIDVVSMHELWIQGEKDYVTLQIIEPDILVTLYKTENALVPGAAESHLQPYTLIQPNETSGYFWGRSELTDLIEPQNTLSMATDDMNRLFGLQIDKLIAFIGWDGLTDEVYDQRRAAGYFNPPPGASVNDLTPNFPPEAMQILDFWQKLINTIAGFPEIMQGRGEQGVRAGSHANTLLKTGSPRLRDRSLLVERQCATAADLTLSLKEYKDPNNYWTNGETLDTIENSTFMLRDLPEDRRVAVDSHSSSPIFADDHAQLVTFGVKAGFIDGDDAIELLNFPMKELLHAKLKDKQRQQQELLKAHPELLEVMFKAKSGRH